MLRACLAGTSGSVLLLVTVPQVPIRDILRTIQGSNHGSVFRGSGSCKAMDPAGTKAGRSLMTGGYARARAGACGIS